jgi:erythronate-4-phosphate dehydrogenase
LKAVVLDVWENEPNIDTELLRMVDIGTPHIAGYSLDGKIAGTIMIYKAACDFFGLQAKYNANDFLPEPETPRLIINPGTGNEQEVLWRAIQKIYDISSDDCNLRQIINQPPDKSGEIFDNLRKNYPVRREFQNTTIVLDVPCKSLARKLAGIGFKVVDERK